MIRNSKQNWQIGATVKVGFLNLRVIGKVPTPGDFAPDAYALESTGGSLKFYRFVPHNGLTKCSGREEALEGASESANLGNVVLMMRRG
jgi:hypothetical protein